MRQNAKSSSRRMPQGGMNRAIGVSGMPPSPPAQGSDDQGFAKYELPSQFQATGSSDGERTEFLPTIIANLNEVDTDGDRKVSFREAMDYRQSAEGTGCDGPTTQDATAFSTSRSATRESKIMPQTVNLTRARVENDGDASASTPSVGA